MWHREVPANSKGRPSSQCHRGVRLGKGGDWLPSKAASKSCANPFRTFLYICTLAVRVAVRSAGADISSWDNWLNERPGSCPFHLGHMSETPAQSPCLEQLARRVCGWKHQNFLVLVSVLQNFYKNDFITKTF